MLTTRTTLPRLVNASFSSPVLNSSVRLDGINANLPVEYAMEAISHAGTVLAVASKEGIAMAAEKVSQLGRTMNIELIKAESHWKAS